MRQLYVILKFYIKANTARLVLLHALKNFTKIADIITFLIQRYLLLRRTERLKHAIQISIQITLTTTIEEIKFSVICLIANLN